MSWLLDVKQTIELMRAERERHDLATACSGPK